jgi:hypothetical protein
MVQTWTDASSASKASLFVNAHFAVFTWLFNMPAFERLAAQTLYGRRFCQALLFTLLSAATHARIVSEFRGERFFQMYSSRSTAPA